MSWREPFTGWNTTVSPQESDFNRIEGNTEYLKDAVDTEVTDRESAITSEASARESADNSEASARESADNVINARTPQSYKTTDSPTFASMTVNGGKAAALYTGSVSTNISFPIGSTVLVISGTSYARNSAIIFYAIGDVYSYQTTPPYGGGTPVSGTWRVHGGILYTVGSYVYLAQRTA